MTDLTYIVGISGYTFGVVVRSEAPWKTWNEFVAFAKANPDKISYGTPGTNTSLHITMEEIAYKQGIKWVHVPHKGNAPSMVALLGGHIDSVADSTGWAPHVQRRQGAAARNLGRESHQALARRAHAEGARLRHRVELAVRPRRHRRGWTRGSSRSLHDAFKKGAEDPLHTAILEKYDQDLWYQSTEDYARYARETFAAEKATMARMQAQSK